MINNPELNHSGFLYHHDGNHNEIGNPHPQYVSSVFSHPVGYSSANGINNWIKIASLSIAKNTTDDWGYVKVGIVNADTNSSTSQLAEIFLKIKYYSGTSIVGELQVKNMKPSLASAVVSVNDSSHFTVDLYVQNLVNFGAFRVTELLKYLTRNTSLTYWDGNTSWLTSLPAGTGTTYTALNPSSQTFSSASSSSVDNNSIFMDSADNGLKLKDQNGNVKQLGQNVTINSGATVTRLFTDPITAYPVASIEYNEVSASNPSIASFPTGGAGLLITYRGMTDIYSHQRYRIRQSNSEYSRFWNTTTNAWDTNFVKISTV